MEYVCVAPGLFVAAPDPAMGRGRGSSVDNGVTMVGDAIREGMTRLSNGSLASLRDCFRFPSIFVGMVNPSVSCCSGRPRA